MRTTKSKLLALLLTLMMVFTMMPVSAFAEGTTGPSIIGMSIGGASATGSGVLTATVEDASGVYLVDESLTLVTSEAVQFQESAAHSKGDLYVQSAEEGSAVLRLDTGDDNDNLTIELSSDDNTTWEGEFSEDFSSMTVAEFANLLQTVNAVLTAGSMEATSSQATNEAYYLYANWNATSVNFLLVPASVTTYKVTYVTGSTSVVWTVPAGTVLDTPEVILTEGQTYGGWFYDSAYENAVSATDTVNSDLTVYAKITTVQTGDFLTMLNAGEDVTINSMTDWNLFVENSSKAVAGQWVTLGIDVDCSNATYASLTFAGSFNGGNHTISNAKFSAVDGNSGMFAKISAGQTVCNVKLSNVTASYAGTYAGALVGEISGTETNHATLQNIVVDNCSVSGRSAGGVAGFVFFTDVTYCASYGTSISGVANGGGIAGISYGFISKCGSSCSPSAMVFVGTAGGIAGKNLEGATITNCWCSATSVIGKSTSATESDNVPSTAAGSGQDTLVANGIDAAHWTFSTADYPQLNMSACMYSVE